jgi:ribosome-associated translation inhibitor RaiA
VKINITTRQIKLAKKLRNDIELRVGLALGRFADRIRTVNISLTLAAPTNGQHIEHCRIEVILRKSISVEASHTDTVAAVDQALPHATRQITRALESEASASSVGIPVKPRRGKPTL